jgi:LysM repeat protein
MEEDINQSSGNMIPVALAVLAIVLAGSGLYFGISANQRLNPITESVDAGSSSSARLEKLISGLDTKIAELSAQVTETQKTLDRVRVYGSQSEQNIKQLASEIKANRDQILKTAEKLNEFVSSGFGGAPAVQAQIADSTSPTLSATSDQTSQAPVAPSGAATYSIQSGDTFARIAGTKGVALQALLDANPDADPRRLSIGQKINIPAR